MSGRVVFVTGGNRGIGLACTKTFLAQGDRVAVTTRGDDDPELKSLDVLSVDCDVTNQESVEAGFAKIEDEYGPVQVLIANAGLNRDTLLIKMTEDQWDLVLNVNLKAAWRCSQRAIKAMLKNKVEDGRIVYMSSIVGYFGSPGQVNYAASKAGLIGMARTIAREYGAKKITANCVNPGPVATEMLAALGEAGAARLTDLVPLKRAARPEEVAAAVNFLASPQASYINGVVLPVDGGAAMGH